MPASGDSPVAPNTFSSSGSRVATSVRCRVNTPIDMPFIQSTSNMSMVCA